jgi:hypothetical protein
MPDKDFMCGALWAIVDIVVRGVFSIPYRARVGLISARAYAMVHCYVTPGIVAVVEPVLFGSI